MNTLTINCSSDRLQIWIKELYFEIPNRGLEIDFPGQLIQWIQEHHITDIYVINGPGSFTTLRVVCLTINLYVSTHPGQVKLWHCTKTDLYDRLLPLLGLTQIAIYIGQRNNMWLYDLTTKTHSIVAKSDIDPSIPYDDVSESYADGHDRVYLDGSNNDSSNISIGYKQQYVGDLHLLDVMTQVDVLHPHYLMEPNISNNGAIVK